MEAANNECDIGHALWPGKETCGAGLFGSLAELEKWAETHQFHLAICLEAVRHAKGFWLAGN